MTTLEELFGPPIHVVTRRQLIEDGELVDVSNATDASGQKLSPFKFPVALTRAAYAATIEVGGHWVPIDNPTAADVEAGAIEELRLPAGQDVSGRLWDVFWMLLCAINPRGPQSFPDLADNERRFSLLVNGPPRRRVHLKSLCGPGDQAEPVITIMLPDED